VYVDDYIAMNQFIRTLPYITREMLQGIESFFLPSKVSGHTGDKHPPRKKKTKRRRIVDNKKDYPAMATGQGSQDNKPPVRKIRRLH
jgi:hypothetical protein